MRTPHILIIRLSALGDIAMLVPVVHSLATQYPDLRVTVLSRAQARPLFDGPVAASSAVLGRVGTPDEL